MRRTCLAAYATLAALSSAQILPTRSYHGLGQPVWVTLQAPRRAKSLELHLLIYGESSPRSRIRATRGRLDLLAAVPALSGPLETSARVQLVVDGKPLGAALIVQPMRNPLISRLSADGKAVEFIPDEDGPMFNGYRTYRDDLLEVETSLGKMSFQFRPDAAPNTCWTIRGLAEGGYFDGSIFHRIVPKRADGNPFVIQGGDPTGTGRGGPGFAYPLEKSTLPHDFGVISIARSTDPNTNGGQFFVCLSRDGTKHLDGRYAAFGQLVAGADVLRKLAAVPIGKEDRPLDPPKILRVRLVSRD